MRKKVTAALLGICIILTGCAGSKVPKLKKPVGEVEDSAKVIKGEMYNIESFDSAITSESEAIKILKSGIVKSVNVSLGDKVNAGDVLVSLNREETSNQSKSVEEQILEKQIDNDYLNEVAEYDIQIAELELSKLRQSSQSTKDLNNKLGEVNRLKSRLSDAKMSQQQEIAQLQLGMTSGSTQEGDITAVHSGTVVYLGAITQGSKLDPGTVVALIARDDSKILFGSYVDVDTLKASHRIYARIGEKEYSVTNVPYDQMILTERLFHKLPLYSTFFIEEAPELQIGMFASIVVEKDYIPEALQIPENALFSDVDGEYVYVKEKNEFVRRDIQTGQKTATMIQVTDGLQEGDEVYVKP